MEWGSDAGKKREKSEKFMLQRSKKLEKIVFNLYNSVNSSLTELLFFLIHRDITMNNLYDNQYGKDMLALFNQAAQVAFTNSLALWEQQVEYVKENASRNFTRTFSAQQFSSPEEVLDFQRKVGETELAELKKNGEACYQLANSAGEEFLTVAQKGRQLSESAFGAVAEKASSVLPNGKAVLFSDMLQNSVKVANDLFQNGFDAAVQASRASADTVATVAKSTKGKKAAK